MSVAAHLTREEYLSLPESPPGVRFELLDGELVTMNDPLPVHQLVVGAIYAELRTWCRAERDRGRVLMPIGTDIGPDTIFGPDLQWFAHGRDLPSVRTRPWPVGDLVVEVASPTTARYDRDVKVGRYLAAGAREVWLVRTDPLGATMVRPGRTGATSPEDVSAVDVPADGRLETTLLPGFSLGLADVLD